MCMPCTRCAHPVAHIHTYSWAVCNATFHQLRTLGHCHPAVEDNKLAISRCEACGLAPCHGWMPWMLQVSAGSWSNRAGRAMAALPAFNAEEDRSRQACLTIPYRLIPYYCTPRILLLDTACTHPTPSSSSHTHIPQWAPTALLRRRCPRVRPFLAAPASQPSLSQLPPHLSHPSPVAGTPAAGWRAVAERSAICVALGAKWRLLENLPLQRRSGTCGKCYTAACGWVIQAHQLPPVTSAGHTSGHAVTCVLCPGRAAAAYATSPTLRAHLHRLARLLPLQVTLVSGRVLLGDFACLDKQGNLILANTSEAVPASSSGGKAEERVMGLVLVPIAQQQSVEVQVWDGSCSSVLHRPMHGGSGRACTCNNARKVLACIGPCNVSRPCNRIHDCVCCAAAPQARC